MKRYFLYTLKLIGLIYEYTVLLGVFVLLALLAIFGGEVSIVINWHSMGDLIKTFKIN